MKGGVKGRDGLRHLDALSAWKAWGEVGQACQSLGTLLGLARSCRALWMFHPSLAQVLTVNVSNIAKWWGFQWLSDEHADRDVGAVRSIRPGGPGSVFLEVLRFDSISHGVQCPCPSLALPFGLPPL